jgi:hypothetical protein
MAVEAISSVADRAQARRRAGVSMSVAGLNAS